MEEATYLSKLASSVTVIHRRESLRASNILQKEAFADPKISFLFDSVVTEVLGEKKVEAVKVKNVKTGEEKVIPFDGLFVAIGYDPNTEIFKGQLDLDKNGYVIVKNETETNIPGVFVAGDVKDFRYRQAVTAAADGCKAALDVDRFLKEPHQVQPITEHEPVPRGRSAEGPHYRRLVSAERCTCCLSSRLYAPSS